MGSALMKLSMFGPNPNEEIAPARTEPNWQHGYRGKTLSQVVTECDTRWKTELPAKTLRQKHGKQWAITSDEDEEVGGIAALPWRDQADSFARLPLDQKAIAHRMDEGDASSDGSD